MAGGGGGGGGQMDMGYHEKGVRSAAYDIIFDYRSNVYDRYRKFS
jgi:hypothetical protein